MWACPIYTVAPVFAQAVTACIVYIGYPGIVTQANPVGSKDLVIWCYETVIFWEMIPCVYVVMPKILRHVHFRISMESVYRSLLHWSLLCFNSTRNDPAIWFLSTGSSTPLDISNFAKGPRKEISLVWRLHLLQNRYQLHHAHRTLFLK